LTFGLSILTNKTNQTNTTNQLIAIWHFIFWLHPKPPALTFFLLTATPQNRNSLRARFPNFSEIP